MDAQEQREQLELLLLSEFHEKLQTLITNYGDRLRQRQINQSMIAMGLAFLQGYPYVVQRQVLQEHGYRLEPVSQEYAPTAEMIN